MYVPGGTADTRAERAVDSTAKTLSHGTDSNCGLIIVFAITLLLSLLGTALPGQSGRLSAGSPPSRNGVDTPS